MKNVGDIVVVREWDDMEKEFGLDDYGDIWINDGRDIGFVASMKPYCGRSFEVAKVLDKSGIYELRGDVDIEEYSFTDAMFVS